MSYFGGSGRIAGDPGLFDVFKRAGRALVGEIPFVRQGRAVIRAIRPPTVSTPQRFSPAVARGQFRPPGGTTAIAQVSGPGTALMVTGRKRRRMNPTNVKALNRAVRRTDAFVRVAKNALKNTGFKVVSKSSGKLTEAAWKKKQHHAG